LPEPLKSVFQGKHRVHSAHGHGLDQHIANRLTREHVVEVVADSARADALLTDRLGGPLEYQLEKLHPTPKPPEESAKSEVDSDKSDKVAGDLADKDDKDATSTRRAPRQMPEGGPPRPNAFGGGKGTLFLVDAHSRAVLWSVYEKPKNTSPDEWTAPPSAWSAGSSRTWPASNPPFFA